jgi:hypothetical protein
MEDFDLASSKILEQGFKAFGVLLSLASLNSEVTSGLIAV